MQNVALSWLVLEVSHSGTVLGAFASARFLPMLVLGPWGGLLADRHDSRRVFIITQIFACAVAVSLAVVVWADVSALWPIFVLGAALGLINVFDAPARQILVYELVDRHHLTNAISLTTILGNIARFVGPIAAGLLIGLVGLGFCFAINALTFIAIFWSVARMRVSEIAQSEFAPTGRGQIRAGFTHVRGDPNLWVPLVMVALSGGLAWEYPITLPLIAKEVFDGDATTFGWLMSAIGLGAIIGGLQTARSPHPTLHTLMWIAFGWGLSLLCAAWAPTLITAFVLLLFVGYGTLAFNTLSKVCLQTASASNMRGRVMSLWSIAWQGTTPIGAPIVGWVGEQAGPRWSLATGGVGAIGSALICLVVLLQHRRRGQAIDSRPHGDDSPAG